MNGSVWIFLYFLVCVCLSEAAWQQFKGSYALLDITSRGGRLMLRQGNETTQEKNKNCACSKIYDPVCASNNKSYYNVCQMECENEPGTVFVVHHGNCIPF